MVWTFLKLLLLSLTPLLPLTAQACEAELAGSYSLRQRSGEWGESLRLIEQAGRLVALTKVQGQWAVSPEPLQPYPAADFATFTRQDAPAGYCGVLVSGLIVARVGPNWHWAGFSAGSGFAIISIGGPREALRQ
jgi:hypothetical protein